MYFNFKQSLILIVLFYFILHLKLKKLKEISKGKDGMKEGNLLFIMQMSFWNFFHFKNDVFSSLFKVENLFYKILLSAGFNLFLSA